MTAKNYHRYPNHLAQNAGDTWTDRDDAAILAADRPSDAVLALTLGRTRQAIHTRRTLLGGADTPNGVPASQTKRETALEVVARIDPMAAAMLYG